MLTNRHQSNLANYPTDVRVVLHLQDVRILALGVLVERPSWCANDTAHLVLHPPMLRRLHSTPRPAPRLPRTISAPEQQQSFIPLVRSTTVPSVPSTSDPDPPVPTAQPAAQSTSPSMFASIGEWMGRARRRSIHTESEAGPSQPRSGDRDRRWSLPGLARSRSHPNESPALPSQASTPQAGPSARSEDLPAPTAVSLSLPQHGTSPRVPTLPLMPALPEDDAAPTPPPPSPPPRLRVQHPYAPLIYPTPAYSHRLYPNYTPYESEWMRTTSYSVDRLSLGLGVSPDDDPVLRVRDFRADHEETIEVGEASSGKAMWGTEGMKVTEWEPENEERRRWAGSMM